MTNAQYLQVKRIEIMIEQETDPHKRQLYRDVLRNTLTRMEG